MGRMNWLNVAEYSPLELFLFAGGCFLWVIVYMILARNIVRKKYFEVPVFAACADVGWEFCWSFLAKTDMGSLLETTYRIWFGFDVFLFSVSVIVISSFRRKLFFFLLFLIFLFFLLRIHCKCSKSCFCFQRL